MESCRYLIIGGGLAVDAAVRGVRELDAKASIRVVSDEDDPTYDRPALSKALWNSAGAELRLGTRIVALDPTHKIAADANGGSFGYERLLLATGVSPRHLQEADASIIYFRRLADFRRAWHSARQGAEFAVIGGGFIGSEISAALAMNGRKMSMIFPGASIGDRVYPRPLANFLNVYFRKHGVGVRFSERVERIDRHADKLLVCTNCNDGVAVDVVIAGIGVEPNVGLAKAAGLKVRSGIVVDEMLRTSHPDIYAAGDVADIPCFAPGSAASFRARGQRGDHGKDRGSQYSRRVRTVSASAVLLFGIVRSRLRGGR
jgi:3-phenylpropionate/trans-cinnamate dioxygenase ferredoxin reductase component